jgi:hypothetical protein
MIPLTAVLRIELQQQVRTLIRRMLWSTWLTILPVDRIQLNTSRAENQDLQKKYDALLHRYKSADEERKALAIEFEMTRVEASDQKEYYSKWQATQAELDASKRQLEALQTEAKKESHRMWELIEASHQQTIKDKQTIRAQKAELKLLKGDGRSKASTPDKASRVKAAIRDVNKENTGEEAENAEPARTAVKRKYDDLLNDPTGKFSVVVHLSINSKLIRCVVFS